MARRKKHTAEQVVNLLHQIEVAVAQGKTTALACKEAEITEQRYYRWRKEYGGLQVGQARRHFNPGALTADQVANLVITEARQGSVEMYINGQKIDPEQANMRDNDLKYEHRPISSSVRQAVLPNDDNVLAVHCHSNGAPQYFDAGLAAQIP